MSVIELPLETEPDEEEMVESRPLDPIEQLYACETPDDVADLLRSHRVRGRRASTYSCPIAAYLFKVAGGGAVVGASEATWLQHDFLQHRRHTPAVEAFVFCFDSGDYVDLMHGGFL